MPFTVRIDPVANSQQASIIPDATEFNVGVMTKEQAAKLAQLGGEGMIIFWQPGVPWSNIVAKINSAHSDTGIFVLLQPSATPYVMDVPANLDRVVLLGMGAPPSESAGPSPVTVNAVSPFKLLGNFFYVDSIAMFFDTTIWTGGGRLGLRLEGSSFFSPLAGTSPQVISLPDNGIMDVSISELSLLAGGTSPFIALGQNSTLNVLCTAAGIVGDFTAALASGAATANANTTVDTTCVISGAAYGAGVVTQVFAANGTAAFCPYTPTTNTDWHNPIPTNLQQALDQLAQRLTTGGL